MRCFSSVGNHCFFLTEKAVVGVGSNSEGQLGYGAQHDRAASPELYPQDASGSNIQRVTYKKWTGHDVTMMAAGYLHTILLEASSKMLWGCGSNNQSRLHYTLKPSKSMLSYLAPLQDLDDIAVDLVACGGQHTCIKSQEPLVGRKGSKVHEGPLVPADASSRIYTFGWNSAGQSGPVDASNLDGLPLPFIDAERVVHITAGYYHTVLVMRNPWQVVILGTLHKLGSLKGVSLAMGLPADTMIEASTSTHSNHWLICGKQLYGAKFDGAKQSKAGKPYPSIIPYSVDPFFKHMEVQYACSGYASILVIADNRMFCHGTFGDFSLPGNKLNDEWTEHPFMEQLKMDTHELQLDAMAGFCHTFFLAVTARWGGPKSSPQQRVYAFGDGQNRIGQAYEQTKIPSPLHLKWISEFGRVLGFSGNPTCSDLLRACFWWTPKTHKDYSQQQRAWVRHLLWCNSPRGGDWGVQKEILYLIIAFAM